tara:strand:- start:1185 stop:1367 length:183 start_codon:yes stop_codon:yes gene_type:complete
MTYEITLGDLKPKIAKELVEQGFANKNNDTIPIVVLEQEDDNIIKNFCINELADIDEQEY